jgi:hypothetical protein
LQRLKTLGYTRSRIENTCNPDARSCLERKRLQGLDSAIATKGCKIPGGFHDQIAVAWDYPGRFDAFIWSSISWELLGWHEKGLLSFQNEDDVSAAITSHTAKSGTYLLPYGPSREGLTPEQVQAAEASVMQKMQKGPLVFAAVRRDGFGSFCAEFSDSSAYPHGKRVLTDLVTLANQRT